MMDKRQQLNAQLFGYFQTLGFYEYRNGFLKGDCVFCRSESKAGVNIERNFYNCFKCGTHSKLLPTVMQIENLPGYKDLFEFLRTYDGANYKPPTVEKIPERPIVLPEGFKLLKYGEGRIGTMARKYMEGRGFSIRELSGSGVGYVGRPKADYFGYIIFPYYKDRKIIYFQTRRYFGSGPKFKNPTREEFGIGKSQVIYNEAILVTAKEVSIVESVTNALTLGGNVIGLNGKKASSWQLSRLIESRATVFNILLDRDAWSEAIKLAAQLIPYKKDRKSVV